MPLARLFISLFSGRPAREACHLSYRGHMHSRVNLALHHLAPANAMGVSALVLRILPSLRSLKSVKAVLIAVPYTSVRSCARIRPPLDHGGKLSGLVWHAPALPATVLPRAGLIEVRLVRDPCLLVKSSLSVHDLTAALMYAVISLFSLVCPYLGHTHTERREKPQRGTVGTSTYGRGRG